MPKIRDFSWVDITVRYYSVSALGVKRVQPAHPAMTLSKHIITSADDEIVSALQLVSLSNGPPASGPGLPQSEPIEPETFVCNTNKNPSEFSTEIAKNYVSLVFWLSCAD
ncbi:hypothetical protein CTI12_AA079960 [Artemisia annua]|uniref:Uncharacterized protein n=1 Tax=Artemisia annua TaxID=35608 RepID=A0A2U1Q308_ARTAN|nr:hypothetical protein CTI12_AA079960 [Artemisia annua]